MPKQRLQELQDAKVEAVDEEIADVAMMDKVDEVDAAGGAREAPWPQAAVAPSPTNNVNAALMNVNAQEHAFMHPST
jgi:hypothetical protein